MNLIALVAAAAAGYFLAFIFINVTIPRRLLQRINAMRRVEGEAELARLASGWMTAGGTPLARSMPGSCAEFSTGYQWGARSDLASIHGRTHALLWGKPLRFLGHSNGTMELPHRWDSRFFSFMFNHGLLYRNYRDENLPAPVEVK